MACQTSIYQFLSVAFKNSSTFFSSKSFWKEKIRTPHTFLINIVQSPNDTSYSILRQENFAEGAQEIEMFPPIFRYLGPVVASCDYARLYRRCAIGMRGKLRFYICYISHQELAFPRFPFCGGSRLRKHIQMQMFG